MSLIPRLLYCCIPAVALFVATANQGDCQTVEEFKDVKYSTGAKLGLNGFEQFSKLSLVDELGFEYDVISLLGDNQVRSVIGIDNQSFQQMRDLHNQFVNEISILSDLTNEKTQTEVKARFYGLQGQLADMLSDDQFDRLQQVKTQKGIERYGLKKFLATTHMRQSLGLDQSTIDAIGSNDSMFEVDLKSLYVHANRELVKALSEKQQTEFKSCFTDFDEEFLTQPLYKNGRSKPVTESETKKFLLRMLGRTSIQRKLELSETQIEKLNTARKDNDSSLTITDVLNDKQSRDFYQLVKKSELSRWGTVGALSLGYVRQLLGITDSQSKELAQLGKRLQSDMKEKIANARLEHWRSQMRDLSNSDREKIESLIGQPIDFKKR